MNRIPKIENILMKTKDAIAVLELKEKKLNRNVSDQWKKILHQNEVNALKSQAYDKIDKLLFDEG